MQVSAKAEGLCPLPEVEPTPERAGHQLDLDEVEVSPVVHVEEQPIPLPRPELELQAGVGRQVPARELCVRAARALQVQGGDLNKEK